MDDGGSSVERGAAHTRTKTKTIGGKKRTEEERGGKRETSINQLKHLPELRCRI